MSFGFGSSYEFDLLEPESVDDDDFFFRCPRCGELFAVGRWLYDGALIERDAGSCTGQFFADGVGVDANVTREATDAE